MTPVNRNAVVPESDIEHKKMCPIMSDRIRVMDCFGSACMMWRWQKGDATKDSGYCGLAGDPRALKP